MTRQQQIRTQYEDALFTLLISEAAEAEGEQLLAEAERLNQDPAAEVPEAVSERCRRVIKREFSRRERIKFRRVLARGFRAALIAACVASLLFTVAFAVSEEVRIYVVNLFIEVHERFTGYRFESDLDPEIPPECPSFEVDWVPEGFVLVEQSPPEVTGLQDVVYEGPQGENLEIAIDALGENGTISFDTEDSTSEDIMLNGRAGTLYTKSYIEAGWPTYVLPGRYMLIMPIPEKRWILSVTLETDFAPGDKEAVLQVAENLVFDGFVPEEGSSYRISTQPAASRWEGAYPSFEPGWLPEEYELVRHIRDELLACDIYEGPREEDLVVKIQVLGSVSTFSAEPEGVEEEPITVNGLSGTFRSKVDPDAPMPYRYEIVVNNPEEPGGFSAYWGSRYDPGETVRETLKRIAENLTRAEHIEAEMP